MFDFVNLYPFSTIILLFLSSGWAGILEPFMLHSSCLFFHNLPPERYFDDMIVHRNVSVASHDS